MGVRPHCVGREILTHIIMEAIRRDSRHFFDGISRVGGKTTLQKAAQAAFFFWEIVFCGRKPPCAARLGNEQESAFMVNRGKKNQRMLCACPLPKTCSWIWNSKSQKTLQKTGFEARKPVDKPGRKCYNIRVERLLRQSVSFRCAFLPALSGQPRTATGGISAWKT